MAINDPITLEYSKKWGYYWQQGHETFYNAKREWITFHTPEEALEWLKTERPQLVKLAVLKPEPPQPENSAGPKTDTGQLTLFE